MIMYTDEQEAEWELSKENVLPLRQGRDVANLTASALQPHTAGYSLVRQQRMSFESELRTYEGDDPLDVWDRYIVWTEQTFPKGGKDSHIQDILHRCVTLFKNDDKYKNDARYLSIWIKFASICDSPSEIFNFLFTNKIGCQLASFYDAWASELERVGNTKKADAIFMQGIQCVAEPVDLLSRKHSEFQARVARRIAGEAVELPEPVTFVEPPKRTTLGALKARGIKGQVANDRANSVIHGTQGIRIGHTTPSQTNNSKDFKIFNDENAEPSTISMPNTGEWAKVPSTDDRKENEQKPGVWTKAKIKQRNVPLMRPSAPQFTVHTDPDADQPMVTPRKLNPQVDQILSAKKPEKKTDPFHQMLQQQQQQDANQQPMYCKHKIYNGALEFSFEELRAARFMDRKKKQEEIELKKALELQREELRRQQEQFLALQQQQAELLEQRLNEQKLLQQHRDERLAMQTNIHHKPHHQQHMINKDRLQNANRTMTMENSLSQSGTTENLLGSSLLPSDNRTPSGSINSSNVMSSVNNFSLNTTASKSSRRSTPNTDSLLGSSSARSLNRSTPISAGKLTAPSPTINTKQAISAVLGLFNETMTLSSNQFGWGAPDKMEDPSDQDFDMHSMKDDKPPGFQIHCDPEPASAPFKIFEENTDLKSVPALARGLGEEENCSMGQLVKTDRSTGLIMALGTHDTSKNNQQRASAGDVDKDHGDISMEYDQVVACPVKQIEDMDDVLEGIEDIPNEMTFAPSYSSTCNFTKFAEAARLASTPFNPSGENAPLLAPPVSNIKPLAPNASTDISDSTNSDDSVARQLRRSTFIGRNSIPNDLSPVIERSDEDEKSLASSAASSTHYSDHQNNTVHALHGHHNSTSSSDASARSSISQTPGFPKVPVLAEPLNTITEESLHNKEEGLGDKTCHEIDITNYIPPENDEKQMLDMSVAINPDDPFDEDEIEGFLSKLTKPLSSHNNYHSQTGLLPALIRGQTVQLGPHKYDIVDRLGSGAFANVFLAKRVNGRKKDNMEVIKVQKPAWPWEFYICSELLERLTKLGCQVDVRPSIMEIKDGYFYFDGSAMTNTLHKYGTLLNLVNKHKTSGIKIHDGFTMLLSIDLMNLLDQMHKCHIIHGDIKPDNLLLTNIPDLSSDNPEDFLRQRTPSLKLIDFGRSIDLDMYPEGTTFTVKVETSGFQCVEMTTNRPWTYQTDLFGLIGTIHVLLFKQYMKVYRPPQGVWRPTSKFKRYVLAADTWQKLFVDFLNIPSCNEIPPLLPYCQAIKKDFVDTVGHDWKNFGFYLNDLKSLMEP